MISSDIEIGAGELVVHSGPKISEGVGQRSEGGRTTFLTNALGDVYARVVDGQEEAVDPDQWGWVSEAPENRRRVEDISALPGYTVTITSDPSLFRVPGPKPKRSKGSLKWDDGAAPAAVTMSKAGAADCAAARYGRLSDALAWATSALPRNPQSRPFHVWDLLVGRLIVVDYQPVIAPGGVGSVYVVEDGIGVKIGYTTGEVAIRVAGLQTGNPRLISTVATILDADDVVEAHLHSQFAKWAMQGEWFDRNQLLALARAAGGWKELLRQRLPERDWNIVLEAPYG